MILRLLLCLVSVCPFFFPLPFFLPYISYDYHWCCCWLLLFCRQSTTVSLGYLVVSLCAEVRCWLGQDKTVGGRQWKKSFWVVWLLRSGRGKYLECRLNGCAGEAPRCGEGTLKSNFFPFLSESRSLTVRCACVRVFLRNIAEGKWEWYLFWAFVFFVATPLFLLPVTVSFVPQPTPQLYHIVSYNHTKWD